MIENKKGCCVPLVWRNIRVSWMEPKHGKCWKSEFLESELPIFISYLGKMKGITVFYNSFLYEHLQSVSIVWYELWIKVWYCFVLTLWKCQNYFLRTLKLPTYCFLSFAYLWICLEQSSFISIQNKIFLE